MSNQVVNAPRKYHSAEQRRRHIQAWQQSGLPKASYAQRHHVNDKTFGNWTRLPPEKPVHPAAPANVAFIPATLASPEPDPVAGTATLNLPAGCSVTAAPAALWLAREPADMRAGIDTLTQKVRAQLELPPHGGAAFVFTNRSRTRIKVLIRDSNGVWLCTRRLHRGRFTWPRDGDDAWPVTAEQFAWLSAGVDWRRLTERPAQPWEG